MLRQFLFGGAVSAVNIAIHALVMTVVIGVAQKASVRAKEESRQSILLVKITVPTVVALMFAHAVEVIVWALSYSLVDATPVDADRVYFAFVNYTTLGYGDIVPVQRWKLLGPMAAMNGVLLFGWSTALIFEVLRRTIARGGSVSANAGSES